MITKSKKWIDNCYKAHCQTCRKAISGFQFRCDISKKFILPDNDVNFNCPFEKEWTEEYIVPPYYVDKNIVEELEQGRVLSLDELEVVIKDLGNPEYLTMKFQTIKWVINNAECTSCVSLSRRKDLIKDIYNWKRMNQ